MPATLSLHLSLHTRVPSVSSIMKSQLDMSCNASTVVSGMNTLVHRFGYCNALNRYLLVQRRANYGKHLSSSVAGRVRWEKRELSGAEGFILTIVTAYCLHSCRSNFQQFWIPPICPPALPKPRDNKWQPYAVSATWAERRPCKNFN